MITNRITEHPVLSVPEPSEVVFYWNKTPMKARKGEMISSALVANGVKVFGHHHKDGTGQGIFCANGQCSKCLVLANGLPVKSCMTAVKSNMVVESVDGLPRLPEAVAGAEIQDIEEIEVPVLIIGGGPAGLSAALEMARFGIKALIVDDKNELGGKLVLQTHKFFGSVEDSHAGTRGNQIGRQLAQEAGENPNLTVWTDSTVLFVFKDKKVGILKAGEYKLVKPQTILNAAGAREKFLRFPGNHLPGIYGAGAFQTLVNRDLVRPSQRLFIVGGGNVGLIAGYHALQAGIPVAGLVEALPQCGGYKVHADKIKRLGIPIYTSHTVLSANGKETLESVTIVKVDERFRPIPGTEKTFACDTLLIAVGLNSIDEFTSETEKAGIPVFAAGDALEIAEASSAMFNGKIAGLKVARFLGAPTGEVPEEWYKKAQVLKSHPGSVQPQTFSEVEEGVMPNIHCLQEIPCNPCTTVCPKKSISTKDGTLMGLPVFNGECIGCGQCVLICPGLAITLVDYRKDPETPEVTVPYEVFNYPVKVGESVKCVDIDGNLLGEFEVSTVQSNSKIKTQLVKIRVPREIAKRVVSFRIQDEEASQPLEKVVMPERTPDDSFLCLCERVKVKEVRELIRQGVRDINQIKAVTRAGMGSCGSKTCELMVKQLFREEGVPLEEVTSNTKRPLFVEVPLGVFAGMKEGGER